MRAMACRVPASSGRPGQTSPCALDEKLDGGIAQEALRRGQVGRIREQERSDDPRVFAAQVEHLAAGEEHLEPGAGAEYVDQERCGRDDLLQVVEDEQDLLWTANIPSTGAPPIDSHPWAAQECALPWCSTSCASRTDQAPESRHHPRNRPGDRRRPGGQCASCQCRRRRSGSPSGLPAGAGGPVTPCTSSTRSTRDVKGTGKGEAEVARR